eukprot:6195211-Pleurochrysis_carterae.AAC.3
MGERGVWHKPEASEARTILTQGGTGRRQGGVISRVGRGSPKWRACRRRRRGRSRRAPEKGRNRKAGGARANAGEVKGERGERGRAGESGQGSRDGSERAESRVQDGVRAAKG